MDQKSPKKTSYQDEQRFLGVVQRLLNSPPKPNKSTPKKEKKPA